VSYCLDTNSIVYYLKGVYPGILARLKTHRPEEILIPEIVRAELLVGVAKSTQKRRNAERVRAFLSPYALLPFAGRAVEHYADIRSNLEARGQPIGPNDLIVAATVRANDAILVTRNTREFGRVDGLKVEDWTV
jgi:tRNA(fMet)-specific endonuclease VapC